jgi:polyhydroxybutyrate depolymerase
LSMMDTFQFFETLDKCPPADKGTLLANTSKKDGTRVRETSLSCDAGTSVVLAAVEGGGHSWPGATQYMPEAIIGTTSQDIDASAYIWTFLSAHSR